LSAYDITLVSGYSLPESCLLEQEKAFGILKHMRAKAAQKNIFLMQTLGPVASKRVGVDLE